ncbi:MAG: peptide ABC transporter substrate-binding protein [Lachnospiraceae bacterium]|nr:peptide ABC transporter substrate-binding protein [Lachnospiraceae bacterium]
MIGKISRRDFLKGSAATAASLALSMTFAGGFSESVVQASEDIDFDEYYTTSTEIYNEVLGEFYDAYMVSKDAETVSERYALMAVAEAKIMEAAVFLPTNSNGGSYRLTRVVPYSATTTLWGTDSDRYFTVLVTTEMISLEDYNALKALWNETRGTGTYETEARAYLEEHGYEVKDEYNLSYNTDPVTWDALATSLSADSEAIVNTYDGLMLYDIENELQPALAESYEVSEDGLTYTFHIREGVSWVDSQGREVAGVVADDFVAGMQHMMDAQGGLEYLIEGIIVNASEYISGEVTDFAEVGVEAVDDYTLVYTLEAPCSYFLTMLGYNVFAPMSRTYYESQGGKFGMEYDSSAADYNYGKSADTIAYCGPYLVTGHTEQNSIVFSANPTYWNADAVNIQTLTWKYDDGSDPTKLYNDFLNGTVDAVGLTSSILELAKSDGYFDDYASVSGTDATTFFNMYNLNRVALVNFNDGTTAPSPKTEEELERSNVAMKNVHFRRALSYATDRASMMAQVRGDELKYTNMRNSYTPWNFVSLEEDVTIDINGEATTFAAGTYYGVIMQAQLDADGIPMNVYDATADDGNGSGDGYDGIYNVDNAVAEMATAVEELAAEGVDISAENPIYLDLVYPSQVEAYTNRANAFKQSIEGALDGQIIINMVDGSDYSGWYYANYYNTYGYEQNSDINDTTGWGPDYGDPSTYLDTLLPDYAGYMTKGFGIF